MMKRKITAILIALVLTFALAACGAGEETTLTGMVVSVDGTVISLMEMDGEMTGMNFGSGDMSQMPEGMEGFQGFGSFNPGDFDGTMPEGGEMPEGGDFSQWGGQMPEGGRFPQWGSGDFSEWDGQMPEGMELPEGMTMPDFSGGDMDFDAESFASDAETKEIDIGDAHISVEIEGGKASGSMEDIKAGTFVTVTMNGKGEVTNVLVSSQSSFGGRGMGQPG